MMKKLFNFLILITLVFSLSACRKNPYEDDNKGDDIIVVDPDKPIVNPEVKPKPEKEPGKEEDKKEPEVKPDPKPEEKPIVKPEEKPKPEISKDPVLVDGIRRYKPGTYVKELNDSFVILLVDDYGRIANVYLDELVEERNYYQDRDNNLYLYLDEDETYHFIKDDSYSKTLSSYDLIRGVHDDKISDLSRANVYKTKYLLGKDYEEEGRTYYSQIDILTDRIILDNGIYGINVYEDNKEFYTDNVRGVKIPIGDFMEMLNEILYTDAKLEDKSILKDLKNPTYGLYNEGRYFKAGTLKYNKYLDEYILDFMLISVDEFGSLSTLYTDSTSGDVLLSMSKNSLEEQLALLASDIKENQNIKYIKEKPIKDSFYTDSISGVTIDIKPYYDLLNNTLETVKYDEYLDGLYLISEDDYNVYFNIINGDIVTTTLDIFDENSRFKEDLTNDLYLNLDLNDFDLSFDGNKITNKEVEELNKDLVNLINAALFDVRDEDPLQNEMGYNFTNLLGTGAYYVEARDYYMYIYYLDNKITTLIIDTNKGVFRNTRVNRLDKDEEAFLELTKTIIDNQSYIIDMMSGEFEYDRIKSLITITDSERFFTNLKDIDLVEVDELLKEFIYTSANKKLNEEMATLEKDFKEYVLAKPIIDGLTDIPLSLPTSSYAVSKDLSNKYTLKYNFRDNYVDIIKSNKPFLDLELKKEIRDTTSTFLDVEVVDVNKDTVYNFSVEIPLYSLEDASKILFKDDSLPSLILTTKDFTLPYKEGNLKYKDLKYVASGDNVRISDTRLSSNTKGTNKIKAYIDKNENNRFDEDELIRSFEVSFIDEKDAYEYLDKNFKLGTVYKEVREDFDLTSNTGIYGVEAKYTVSSSYQNIISLETKEDGITHASITRPSSTKEVMINVNFTGIDRNKKFYFDVVKRDEKSNYEYALETVNSFDVSRIDLDRVVYGTDFKFDDFLMNLKYFDYDTTSKGEVYSEDVEIIVSDFGKYIDEYTGEVVRITDNLSTDINLEIKITASYPTKKASDARTAERVIEITLIPKPDIEKIIEADVDEFEDFSVDISMNLEKQVLIELPTTGKSGLSTITYSMDNNDEVYTLQDNKLIVHTTKNSFVNNYDKSFDLDVRVSYGGYHADKTIKLRVKE